MFMYMTAKKKQHGPGPGAPDRGKTFVFNEEIAANSLLFLKKA